MGPKYRDYYQVLGIDKNATEQEIKAAFRKLARQYHPDVHSGSSKAAAEEKFKEINEAYEVLSDPEKRAKYDRLGSNWQHGQEWQPPPDMDGFQYYTWGDAGDFDDIPFGSSGFSDFFEMLFGRGVPGGFSSFHRSGGGYQGADLETTIQLSLEEAYRGGEKLLKLNTRIACSHCKGTGRLNSRLCKFCSGTGSSETAKTLEVRIPPGVKDGSKIRLKGMGHEGAPGNPKGDLYLKVEIAPHRVFTLNNDDIETEITLLPHQAVLGDRVSVPTLDGEVMVTVQPLSRNGQKLRLRGKGWPRKNGTRGDQYVKVVIDIPPGLSAREKELYEKLAELHKKAPPGM